MSFTKSTVTTNNISALATQPTETATQLKAKFDQYGVDDKVRFNALIDELEASTGTSGAENIGSKTIVGVTGNTPHAQITDVKAQLDARNAENVKLTGNQTVAGVKTFSSSPIVPGPTTDTQASTKKYVDDENLKDAHLTGDQTIAGIKTFSSSPIVPTPTTATQASNKDYIDTVAANFVLGIISDNSLTNAKLGTDIKIGSLATLTTTEKGSVVGAINEVNAKSTVPADNSITNTKLASDVKVGSLATLGTTEKASVVGAVNELNTKIGTTMCQFKSGTGTFTDNDTAQTFTDSFCTASSLVTVAITSGTPAGSWVVDSAAGSFTITSSVAESSDISFDYYIQKAVS